MKVKENLEIEYIFKFIASFLSVYERIGLKGENKLACLEKEFDTFDFNEVPYLILNEINIEEDMYYKIQKLEEQIRELYLIDILKYKIENDKKIISIYYGDRYYDIVYDKKGFTYRKSKDANFGSYHACGLDFFINQKIKKLER